MTSAHLRSQSRRSLRALRARRWAHALRRVSPLGLPRSARSARSPPPAALRWKANEGGSSRAYQGTKGLGLVSRLCFYCGRLCTLKQRVHNRLHKRLRQVSAVRGPAPLPALPPHLTIMSPNQALRRSQTKERCITRFHCNPQGPCGSFSCSLRSHEPLPHGHSGSQ